MQKPELTFGDIIRAFGMQFPGLDVNDVRPNSCNELYIWLSKAPTNLIATYDPETDTFSVKTTREKWAILADPNVDEEMVRYAENDARMTEEILRAQAESEFDRSNSPKEIRKRAANSCEAMYLDD